MRQVRGSFCLSVVVASAVQVCVVGLNELKCRPCARACVCVCKRNNCLLSRMHSLMLNLTGYYLVSTSLLVVKLS